MNALPSRPPPPPSSADESSTVRPRPRDRDQEPRLDRHVRARSRLKQAEALLASLPADHPQARLLRVAIVRRDEILIDNVIAQLSG